MHRTLPVVALGAALVIVGAGNSSAGRADAAGTAPSGGMAADNTAEICTSGGEAARDRQALAVPTPGAPWSWS